MLQSRDGFGGGDHEDAKELGLKSGAGTSSRLDLRSFVKFAQDFFVENCKKTKFIVLLSGPMGAGKTEFVRACVGDAVVSPTFALQQVYQVGREVQHWDLYRLESPEEVEGTGFWDQFDALEYFVFIEWPEKLRSLPLPRNAETVLVRIDVEGEDRRIHIS